MDNELNRMIYGIEQSMHMQAKRQLASAKREVTYQRIFGGFFALIAALYLFVFFAAEDTDWSRIIFVVIFGSFAGFGVWLGWFFYPRMVTRWEGLVRESENRMRLHVEMNGMPSYE